MVLARLQQASGNKGTSKHRETVVNQFLAFLAGREATPALYLQFMTQNIEAKEGDKRKYVSTILWSRRSHLLKHFRTFMNPPLDVSSVDKIVYDALTALGKNHVPRHAKMFSVAELFQFWATVPNTGEWLRAKAISLVGFYGLARNSELVKLTWNEVTENERGVWIRIQRSKCRLEDSWNDILIPRISGHRIVPADVFLMYRDSVAQRPHPRMWRKWNEHNKMWFLQPLGENKIREVPALVASFLHPGQPTTGYRGHSWRPSGATALATYGGSVLQLKTAGNWASDRVAESYARDNPTVRSEIAEKISGPASQDENAVVTDVSLAPQPSLAPPASKIPKITFTMPLHNCTIMIAETITTLPPTTPTVMLPQP